MRDTLITLIFLAGIIYTIKKPYIGILLWSWLSYMNPHRLAYGFAYRIPYAQITAVVLLIVLLINKDKQKIPLNKITVIWVGFILLMGLTTVLAYYPDLAADQFKKVIKIQFMTFLTMVLITDIHKLRHLIWVIIASIGYYSIKGGIFTVITGGSWRIWGPSGSFIEENNALAVAVLMIIPLMVYMYQTTEYKWVKKALFFSILLSCFSVVGSQSRGALLAITALGVFFWFKSKRKVMIGFIILSIATTLFSFMPESWHERMNTINTYEEDRSAMSRLNTWEYSLNAANDNLFGMGFESHSDETFLAYAPNPLDVHSAHSIYFTILADHGWIGLVAFLLIYFFSWSLLKSIIKKTSGNIDLAEYNILSRMLQLSFISYFVGGAFLSLSYFDLPWHLISIVILLHFFLEKQSDDQSKVN